MNLKQRSLKGILSVWTLPAAVLMVLVISAGCKKEQPTAQPPSEQTKQTDAQASQTATDQSTATTVAVEQKTCPVMEGNPINKNIFVEYKGEKVYFCCKGCPEKFLANPEKYIAKLPQFQN